VGERPARILHLPWNIGGNPIGLSRAERELGLQSDVAVLSAHEYGYEADIDLGLGAREDPRAQARKAAVLARAARRYDVFHFNFGRTLFHRLRGGRLRSEIPLLRRLGKTVLATFQGDDARPPSANPFGPQDPGYLEMQSRFQPARRALMLNGAHRVFFLNPDLREWLPGAEYRPYASVDPREIEVAPPGGGGGDGEVVVAHAPSDRGIKGTEHVIEAVEALRGEGLALRLDLVEGVPHAEAMRRFASADMAVDQLNLGWYGGFAVELMAMGRPVLCHIREDEPGDNPFGEELPIVRATRESLREELRALASDRDRRVRVGGESRAFVERHHDPLRIARSNLEGLVPIPRRAPRPAGRGAG
jgi:glycosyltransferase involved in cell wall biosynthesis